MEVVVSNRDIAVAALAVLRLWMNPDYVDFLRGKKKPTLTNSWFDRFVNGWSVGRTIKSKKRPYIRRHFQEVLRPALARRDPVKGIEDAARYLQTKKWSSRNSEEGSFPISIVSKVGFFLDADRIAPLDSFSLDGLNELRGRKKEGGLGFVKRGEYRKYLAAFNEKYDQQWTARILNTTDAGWLKAVAKKVGCPASCLKSERFRRKVFDAILMQIGRRVAASRRARS
jgi:hypothetical protein